MKALPSPHADPLTHHSLLYHEIWDIIHARKKEAESPASDIGGWAIS